MRLEFEYLSWKKLHSLCFDLLVKIEEKRLKLDRVAYLL